MFNYNNIITGNYNVQPSDGFIGCITSQATNIYLLPLSGTPNTFEILIKDVSGQASINPITITGNGSDLIDGQRTQVINTNYGFIRLWKSTAGWSIDSASALPSAPSNNNNQVILSVSSTGSDNDPSRPSIITNGSWTTHPFATPQAALNSLSKVNSNTRTKIIINAGTYPGYTVEGFTGSGDLCLLPQLKSATLATGVNSGTVGPGSSTTQVNLPTGSANWTVTSMRGLLFQVTSGGGVSSDSDLLTSRVIKSNGTNFLIIDAISGLNSATKFQIMTNSVTISQAVSPPISGQIMCASYQNNTLPIRTLGLNCTQTNSNYGIYSFNNNRVEFYGCSQYQTSTVAQVRSLDDRFFRFNNSSLTYSNLWVTDTQWTEVNQITDDVSTVLLEQGSSALVQIDSLSCTGTAVSVHKFNNVLLGLNANNNSVTPLDLQSILRFDNQGLYGSGNTGYGITFSRGGLYNLTGGTLTGGSGDMTVDGTATTWTSLGSLQAICGPFGGTMICING